MTTQDQPRLHVVDGTPPEPERSIPDQLRRLAERIEAGEFGEVDSLLAVMPREHNYPQTFGWGCVEGAYDPLIQFELARRWHVDAAAGLLSC